MVVPRLTTDVSIGQLLQVLALVGAGVVYVVTTNTTATATKQDLGDFRVEVAKQIADVKASVNTGINGLQNQITNLPDVTARLNAMERRMNDVERHLSAQDGRLDDQQRLSVETHADLEALIRASPQYQGPLAAGNRK
jgi:hypothetical protein